MLVNFYRNQRWQPPPRLTGGECYNRRPFRAPQPNPVIFTLGINHHSAPLAIRERVAFGADKLPQALADLTRDQPVSEVAILFTCNRTEIYCAAESPDVVIDWLAQYHQVARERDRPLHLHPRPAGSDPPCLPRRQRARFDGHRRAADSRPDEGRGARRRRERHPRHATAQAVPALVLGGQGSPQHDGDRRQHRLHGGGRRPSGRAHFRVDRHASASCSSAPAR